ncbi:MAG: ABC transporter substrate-binding protein [Rhodospirillales bacterium]|nr:ABC transporter substrate-binding protein [Rhodospirillales bacterium]
MPHTSCRRWLALLGAAALALLPSVVAAQTGPTLRIALRDDPDVLDPTFSRTYTGRIVFAGLCDKLFDIDQKLTIVPKLASGYEWSDSKTLLIHLRPGVRFHDGEIMDAAAVKASLDRHLTAPGSFRRLEISEIDHVEVVDPATVRIVLKYPSAPFLAQLTDRAGMIVAPEAVAKLGKDFGNHPVCNGPFQFTERIAQDRIVLDRFPGYWDPESIHLARVVYLTMPDSSVRLANLQAGAIDLSEQIVPTDVKTAQANPKLRVVVSDALGYQGITNNVANGPRAQGPYGKDPRVRHAFELSLDRTALLQVVYDGMYPATAQAVPPTSPYYVASVRPPARDVARARALLKEAGVPTPFPLELLVPNSPDMLQVAEVIQSMAAEAGFAVKIRAMEAGSALDAMIAGNFEAGFLYWSGRPDPDGNLYSFLHTGGPFNEGHYSSPVVDSLLDAGRGTAGVEARRAIYEKMWAQETQDLAVTYLWSWRNIVGMSARVRGFVPIPDGLIRLQGVSLAE